MGPIKTIKTIKTIRTNRIFIIVRDYLNALWVLRS